MPLGRITDTDDSGGGTDGTIHNNAWLQTLFDAIENSSTWDTYTPAWTAVTANPSLGNGTLTGRYFKIGKLYIVEISLAMGSTTTFGTGNYRWSLPTAAASGAPILGIADAEDSGTANYTGLTRLVTTTTFCVIVDGAATQWSPTVPFTWAVSVDTARFMVAYRAA